MARITQHVIIDAPLDRVWAEASDLPSHVEWMADAESIEFLGEARSGVGTRMKVETVVGPLRTADLMEVTEWDEGSAIGVSHKGLVKGRGRFELTEIEGGIRFAWTESLTFPWYLGGEITAQLAKPLLGWIWRRNLRGLKDRIES